MPTPMDPTSTAFLFAESRSQPMHVGGLQLFLKPPAGSLSTARQWFWTQDHQFDLEYHFRHSALPKPGRLRELLELCGRLHGTRLALERPLWEVHLIEGLRDGR